MVTLSQLLAFLLAAVLITVVPGPDNLMVLGMGLSRGRRQGLAFGLGCACGCLSHTVLAVLGVSALIAASAPAFAALKVLGGGYLVWLGVQTLRRAGQRRGAREDAAEESLGALFRRGVIANAINPKVVLFFLAFLPQFVEPAQGRVDLQLGVLGFVFAVQAAVVFAAVALCAGSLGAVSHRRPRVAVWLDRIAGTVFVGLGLRMAVSR